MYIAIPQYYFKVKMATFAILFLITFSIICCIKSVKSDNMFNLEYKEAYYPNKTLVPYSEHEYSIYHRTTDSNGECRMAMFGNDSNAYWACLTENALQNNWFPSPIAGLFTYLDWNGYSGFWQNGAVLETLVNFMHYAKHTRYMNVILNAHRPLDDLLHAYHPQPSFDDEGWFALAYARIYELTGNKTYLDTALAIYNWTWQLGWDSSGNCHGGFYYDGRYSKKITIINAQMLKLAAKFARIHPDRNLASSFLKQAERTFEYIIANKVINDTTYDVSDEVDIYSCKANTKYNFTYNSGVMVGGLVEMYKFTHNASYLELAHRVAMTCMKHNSRNGILIEYCADDACVDDPNAPSFKGLFMRNLRYLMDMSNSSMQATYTSWIKYNVKAIIDNAHCKRPIHECHLVFIDGKPKKFNPIGPVFGTNWYRPIKVSLPAQQTSALDTFVAAIDPSTKCEGPGCDYNPPIHIHWVDCKTTPCPTDYTCCTWDVKYNTCCTPGQQCYDGGCY